MAAPRLRRPGFVVPLPTLLPAVPEHALFEEIEARLERSARNTYNVLLSRMVSFADAYGRALKGR